MLVQVPECILIPAGFCISSFSMYAYNKCIMQEYLGPEIISRFVIHGTSVAEIVKYLITFLKKNDDDLPKTFLEALKKVRLMNIEQAYFEDFCPLLILFAYIRDFLFLYLTRPTIDI